MLFYSTAISFILFTSKAVAGMKGMGAKTRMWTFGSNGVAVYSPDGSEEVISHPPEEVCYNVTSSYNGQTRVRCDFMDVESDNKKYIWAAVARGVSKINVFSIETGEMVGIFDTCMTPRDLEFHSLRDEMWVHCYDASEYENSHMDVFATDSPSAPISTRIMMANTTENLRSYGKSVIHSSLGDVGYSTVYGEKNLFKVGLSEKEVIDKIYPSDNDAIFGYYDIAYSQVNKHVFVRSQVCCSCNFVGADTTECGRYGSYNITLDDQLVEGQCGRHCGGGPRDTIGIFEIDTNTDEVVGQHAYVGSAPVETMVSSADGEYVVLFGMNGGKIVRLLKAGQNGKKSEIAHDIELDFNTTLAEDDNVYSDLAFIKHNGLDLLVLSTGAENKVAIIDMSKEKPTASYVMLRDGPYEGSVRSRQLEWAVDTDYVWISGYGYEEIYVVDFVKQELVKTFTENQNRKLLSVKNDNFFALASAMENHWKETEVFQKYSKEGSNDTLSYVAIGIAIVAIVAVISNVMTMNSEKKKLAQLRAESAKVPTSEIQGEQAISA